MRVSENLRPYLLDMDFLPEAHGDFGLMGILTESKLESLILAQNERWRQA